MEVKGAQKVQNTVQFLLILQNVQKKIRQTLEK